MPSNNRAYVDEALNELLVKGLLPFVQRQFETRTELEAAVRDCVRSQANRRDVTFDAQALLQVMNQYWDSSFRDYFQPRPRLVRSYVNELIEVRNHHAHPDRAEQLSDDDTDRALDTIARLLFAIDAKEADDVQRIKQEFEDSRRSNTAVVPAENPALPVPIAPLTPANATLAINPAQGSIVTVAQDGTGHYTTIAEAICRVQPNTRIEVHPGHYTEGLVIDKPLEIIGVGRREDIVIQAKHVSCIEMRTNEAKVQGLTLMYVVAEEEFGDDEASTHAWNQAMCEYAVDISGGRLVLENCVISSYAEGIRVQGAIVMRECKLGEGITVEPDAWATLEECEIASAWTSVRSRGNLVMRRCVVNDGVAGILLESGYAEIKDCEIYMIRGSIYGQGASGIEVDFCNTVIRDCRIHDIEGSGVTINGVEPDEFYELISLPRGPRCILEDCEIHDTTASALEVHGRTRAEIKRCTMRDSQAAGVYVGDYGRVALEACTIRANAGAGVEIASNSAPELYNCTIEKNGGQAGILVYENRDYASGVQSCDISRNAHAGIEIGTNGDLRVGLCCINDNGDAAVYAHDGATGFIAECDVRDNGDEPWQIEPGCRVYHERNYGGDD